MHLPAHSRNRSSHYRRGALSTTVAVTMIAAALFSPAASAATKKKTPTTKRAAVTTKKAAVTTAPATTSVTTAAPTSAKPLKIGLVAPYSGVFGFYGPVMEAVMKLRFQQAPSMAGRTIDVVTEDDQSDPKSSLAKVKKLVEESKVNVIVCCVNGASSLAVAPYLADAGVPMIAPIPGPKGLEAFKTSFSIGFSPTQLGTPFGKYAYDKLKAKTAVIFASDFVQGRLVMDAFKEGFTKAGGKIINEIYPPLDNADYGPFLSKIGTDADIVVSFFGGADAVRAVKQADAAGLNIRNRWVGLGPIVTKLVLGNMGDAAVGIEAFFHYPEDGIETSGNMEFLAALEGKVPNTPPRNFVQANAFATATVIMAAAKTAGPSASGDELLKGLKGVNVQVPWGTLQFDPDTRYAVMNGYHYKVVKGANGALKHEILGTFDGMKP